MIDAGTPLGAKVCLTAETFKTSPWMMVRLLSMVEIGTWWFSWSILRSFSGVRATSGC